MGVISSTLKLMDGSTSVMQKVISSANKMVDVMEEINRAADIPNLDHMFADVRTEINLAAHALDDFNQELQDAQNQPDEITKGIGGWQGGIMAANAALDLFQKGLNAAKKVAGFVSGLLENADTANLGQQQLAVVMANQGADYYGFQSVLDKAQEMQGRSTYGSELFVGAAAELSTYIKSEEAINRLLDTTMADYAAGMGGVNLTYQQMVDYATQLGKSLDGTYDGLLKKGFVLTDAQKEIIELGTEMERVAVLEEVIGDSWSGLSEALAQTPQGVLQSMNNELQAIRTNMGQQLYGEVLKLAQVVTDNMPLIQQLADFAVQALSGVVSFVADPLLPGVFAFGEAMQRAGEFVSENWGVIEPILWGVGIAVAALTTYVAIYTAVQWALNSAMLANPITLIVLGIALLIAAIVGVIIYINRLWQSNVDFKVKVISLWNGLLGFFDQVPIFFQGVGNGVLDAFSYMKAGTAVILQNMVNFAIDQINKLIEIVNKIPGVSIDAIEGVTFGATVAIEEEAKRQARADDLQESKDAAALKAAEREAQLAEDAARWREEAAAKEAELLAEQEEANKDPYADLFNGNAGGSSVYDDPVEIGGGTVDKVNKIGSEVDISNQSLAYLRDIAEIQALESVNAYNVISYEGIQETRLSKADADLLKSSSGGDTKVYYLNYTGGVRINADVKRGEDWETVRKQWEEEIDSDIEVGLSKIDKVVNG